MKAECRQAARARARALILSAAAFCAVAIAVAWSAPPARAGIWVQASCRNPDDSYAGTSGWGSQVQGSPGDGSVASANCSPTADMSAALSTAASAPVGTSETLEYTPPPGSTLDGGIVSVVMYADGFGTDASGTAVAYSPDFAYDGSDVIEQCAYAATACGSAPHLYDFAGAISIPPGRGGSFFLSAGCGGGAGQSCNEGGNQGDWSLVQVAWADFELDNTSEPAASGFGGSLLLPGASGTADVALTASDPGGPGVYTVTATIDGEMVYSATPDTNDGDCVSPGTYDDAPVFDSSQPCRTSESVDIPVDTTQFPDGRHTLKILVEDAAQNTAVVYDAPITTANAPVPAGTPLVSGTAQVGGELSGTDTTFSAPGGQGVSLQREWEDCDLSAGNCQPIGGANAATYTVSANDAGHTIRFVDVATDADGTTTAASVPTTAVAAVDGIGPAGVATDHALTIDRGAANGTPASDTATVDVGWLSATTQRTVLVRRRGHRGTTKRVVSTTTRLTGTSAGVPYPATATAAGRLLSSTGQPVAGAEIEVFSTPTAPGSAAALEGTAVTRTDGTFTYVTPARQPSRTLSFDYRSHQNDTALAGQAQLGLTVPTTVRLAVTPRRVHRGSTVVITGSIPGPIPSPGTLVTLQARAGGARSWTTFQVIRASASGAFRSSYRFRLAASVTYLMRAVVTTQAGYPYAGAASSPVSIREG